MQIWVSTLLNSAQAPDQQLLGAACLSRGAHRQLFLQPFIAQAGFGAFMELPLVDGCLPGIFLLMELLC